MFLGQPCCICIKEDNFDLKGCETDVAGILSGTHWKSCSAERSITYLGHDF